ncbi:putative tetratricopeptide-like helical domain superfamily, DYW domain-containing protein [Dioscorea sansibarensis]
MSSFHPSIINPSFISLLENCHSIKQFKQIHSLIIRSGLALSPAHRRRMLSFCCSLPATDLAYARLLFDEMPVQDASLSNTMMRAYSDHNDPSSALALYTGMLGRGLRPNNYTFPFLLKSFDGDTTTAHGEELHAHVLKFGLWSNAFVRCQLIHMYALSGRSHTARQLFELSPDRDVVIWNSLMSVLSASAKLKDLEFGSRVHLVVKEDEAVLRTLKVENALVDMYAACGDMSTAWSLFENMKSRDVLTWTSMVTGFANSGDTDRARFLFDLMPQKDFVSWTAMINGYVQAHQFKEALTIFREMQDSKIHPDEYTMVSLLTACAQLGALEVGEWIRLYMARNKIKIDIAVANALIDMYSKCGCIERAVKIFEIMTMKDKFTWTAMITGLAVNGHGEEALGIFYQMLKTSTRPDAITYIGVLSACTHAGMATKGRELFSRMVTDHGIIPNVVHYGCLVDLLGRTGHLKEAFQTIKNMPMRPNATVWGALLGACRVYKNVEMAELAAKQLLELQPENSAVYVLLSNIYAKCKKWDKVHKMRELIMNKGIKKVPGCSLTEIKGTVHEFVAGDKSHPMSEKIYSKLEDMSKELKRAGYVPDTSEAFLDMSEEAKESAVYQHSEKLAIAFGLLNSDDGVTIRIVKNLRICVDCHNAIKIFSKVYAREVVVRDHTRFHHFRHGFCSCKDYW